MCRSTAPPSAEPPPITPWMPYFAMKSKARSEPLWVAASIRPAAEASTLGPSGHAHHMFLCFAHVSHDPDP